jgi:hypothetical protein
MKTPAEELDRPWTLVGICLFVIGLFLVLAMAVGADLLWLVALGDRVRENGGIPDGVPFAAAPTGDWPPVLVIAEIVLSLLHEGGLAALLITHLVLVMTTLLLVTLDARRAGASGPATAIVLAALFIGGLTTFGVVRLQTFSLVPFVLMLLLLRAETRNPSRRIWWAPGLILVWGNLHGAVLLGVCLLGAYLVFARLRRRPMESVAVGLASLLALFGTPATWRTAEYYVGVLQNQAAAQNEGLWARPSLTSPFDVLMLIAVLLFAGMALRGRPRVWEYVAAAGLAVATVMAARNGVWLLLFLAPLAATGNVRSPRPGTTLARPDPRVVALALIGLVMAGAGLAQRASTMAETDEELAHEVLARVGDGVVLAPAPAVESLAVHGVTIWAGNPLDAFAPQDQRTYLDFLAGRPGMTIAVEDSDAVLVKVDSEAAAAMDTMAGFEGERLLGSWVLFRRA